MGEPADRETRQCSQVRLEARFFAYICHVRSFVVRINPLRLCLLRRCTPYGPARHSGKLQISVRLCLGVFDLKLHLLLGIPERLGCAFPLGASSNCSLRSSVVQDGGFVRQRIYSVDCNKHVVVTVIYTQTAGARRWCEFSRGAAQSEVDRNDGVCGTRFVMTASPIGRKKIAHRFIGGFWCENRVSPVRDDRAGLWRLTFSFAPPGLWPLFTRDPRLKPWAIFGRPCRDFATCPQSEIPV
jgi:hypothetical protein